MFVEVEAAMVQQDVIRQSSSTACYFAPGEGSIPGVKVMIESDRCISINMVNVQLSPEEVERNHWYTLTAQEDEAYRQQVHPQSVSFRRRVSDVGRLPSSYSAGEDLVFTRGQCDRKHPGEPSGVFPSDAEICHCGAIYWQPWSLTLGAGGVLPDPGVRRQGGIQGPGGASSGS